MPGLALSVTREGDVAHVVAATTSFCAEQGFSALQTAHVATAASELANNLWMHSLHGGQLRLHRLAGPAGGTGIELQAEDDGPGIADIELALSEGYSTGGSLGCGLPGVRRLMDDFSIRSAPGRGTLVTARKWQAAATR